METMEQAIALFKSEQNELQNTHSQQTVCRMADGRSVKQVDDCTFEVTTYKGKPATQAEIAKETAQLLVAYPKMTDAFMAVLMQEIVEDNWTIEHVKDAVKSLKRRQLYPTFTIGDFMSYDKPFKLYNHSGYEWLITSHRAIDADSCGPKSDFGKITIEGKVFFYLKKDLPIKK